MKTIDNPTIRSKMLEVFNLVMYLNGLESRQREITGTKPTLFITYWGHINTVELTAYPAGWHSDAGTGVEIRARLNDEDCENKLDEILHFLEMMKDAGNN